MHSFLAQQIDVELVEGKDQFVDDDRPDPIVFRNESALGVLGLLSAWR